MVHYQAYPSNKLEDREIRSLNPYLNGFIHGACLNHPFPLAGILIASAAQLAPQKFKLKITPAQLLPYYIVAPVAHLGFMHLVLKIFATRCNQVPSKFLKKKIEYLRETIREHYTLPKENTDLTQKYTLCTARLGLQGLGRYFWLCDINLRDSCRPQRTISVETPPYLILAHSHTKKWSDLATL